MHDALRTHERMLTEPLYEGNKIQIEIASALRETAEAYRGIKKATWALAFGTIWLGVAAIVAAWIQLRV